MSQRFGAKGPHWPPLASANCATPKYFARKVALPFRCWLTKSEKLTERRDCGKGRYFTCSVRTIRLRGKELAPLDTGSAGWARTHFNWAEASFLGRAMSTFIFT